MTSPQHPWWCLTPAKLWGLRYFTSLVRKLIPFGSLLWRCTRQQTRSTVNCQKRQMCFVFAPYKINIFFIIYCSFNCLWLSIVIVFSIIIRWSKKKKWKKKQWKQVSRTFSIPIFHIHIIFYYSINSPPFFIEFPNLIYLSPF